MTGPGSQVEGDDDVLMLLDISRAHLHSPLARAVFVTIDGKVYKLLKAMYGLRHAGAAFDREVLDVMNLMGVSLGKLSICAGYWKVIDRLVRPFEWTKVAVQGIPRRVGEALVGQDDSGDGAQC